jgi:two-component system, LytTR family, sensor kinase
LKNSFFKKEGTIRLTLKMLIHTIFWSVFLLFTFMVSLIRTKISELPALQDIVPHLIVNTVWAAVIFYLFYGYFIRYFESRQFFRYLIYSLVVSTVLTFGFFLIHRCLNAKFQIFRFGLFVPPIIGSFILAQCGSLVRGFENWFSNMQLKAELENRNLKNELELLKSQINPHFLFNTLNNIDAFIHTSPEEASRSLITLSDMLRYMIYDTKSNLVPLAKEIEYIRNYIQLQRIRYSDPDSIRFSVPKDCQKIFVVPMLLIPFIENSFKYSVQVGKQPVIDISLVCDRQVLHFMCSNYYDEKKQEYGRPGGVGLENVKRRLELLYPGNYQLTISKENDIFSVDLKLHFIH